MTQLIKISVLALAASLALVGCSASPPAAPESSPITQASEPATTQASDPGVEPATGKTIEGSGYSFVVPDGWAVPPGGEAQAGVDTVVADTTDTAGYANNVTVALAPANEITPGQAESTGVNKLEKSGAKNAKLDDPVTIGGSDAVHLSALFVDHYQIEQYYFSHDVQTYIATFSFSPTVSEAARKEVSASVLATWSWT